MSESTSGSRLDRARETMVRWLPKATATAIEDLVHAMIEHHEESMPHIEPGKAFPSWEMVALPPSGSQPIHPRVPYCDVVIWNGRVVKNRLGINTETHGARVLNLGLDTPDEIELLEMGDCPDPGAHDPIETGREAALGQWEARWSALKAWVGEQPASLGWPSSVLSQIRFIEDQVIVGAPVATEPPETLLGVVSPAEPPEDADDSSRGVETPSAAQAADPPIYQPGTSEPTPDWHTTQCSLTRGSSRLWCQCAIIRKLNVDKHQLAVELRQERESSSHRQQLRAEAERLLSTLLRLTEGRVNEWDFGRLAAVRLETDTFLTVPTPWDGKTRP